MTWNDLNVFQYQQLEKILLGENPLGHAMRIIAIINSTTESQVEKYSHKRLLKELQKIKFLITQFDGKPKDYIQIGLKRYICNYDINKVNTARYIETKVFAKDFVQNLHKVAASMVIPTVLTPLGYFTKRYNATLHSIYSQDIQEANFVDVYFSVTKYVKMIADLDSNYKGLYDEIDQDMESQQQRGGSRFVEFYGWQYCAKIVAEHENITLDAAYNLPVIQFLNDLSYLKAERDYIKNG
jgi:hypothetical protein